MIATADPEAFCKISKDLSTATERLFGAPAPDPSSSSLRSTVTFESKSEKLLPCRLICVNEVGKSQVFGQPLQAIRSTKLLLPLPLPPVKNTAPPPIGESQFSLIVQMTGYSYHWNVQKETLSEPHKRESQ